MAETVDLTPLASLVRENLTETKGIRRDVADVRTLALQTLDYMRRMEQRLDGRISGLDGRIASLRDDFDGRISALDGRIASLRDDLELMIKAEPMGRLAHFETRMENLLHEGLGAIERAD
jgi:hypothetical protein